MITVGQTRRDVARPYLNLAAASYDVLGYRSWGAAMDCAERLMNRFNCGFEPVEHDRKFYAVEVVAKQSSVYGEKVHRVKGSSRWAMVRAGAVKFDGGRDA